jgi:hypothetical protein
MTREVKLNHIEDVLEELQYPIDEDDAIAELSDVTVLLADGRSNLGELVSRTSGEKFDSPGDIETAIQNTLPRSAVGEPYQSEGEG